ncbi:DNA-deoxyinosine glycosylase [Hydrogenimonas urashimensis]|uniref:DNA-deoxyinosine glycosylase n=1 Tax=Hydrogenimonas urashimensis TaxID=2740515 RepID=UPI001915CC07|nr:DNA-deoxyinosine glycosylase [Hydrogenimonas urashimensis]
MPKSNNDSTHSKKAGVSPVSHPFPPIIFPDSKILILGSFPSLKSFENSFYYAHPRNQFWPLLSAIFDMPVATREEKRALLERHKIALWDVVQSCERTNSADTNLQNCRCNDIEKLLKTHPKIEAVFFTGKKAQQLFKHCFPGLQIRQELLPSPSPAYAAMRFEEKLKRWKEVLRVES